MERIHYIDLVKGIGIILVIAQHWFQKDAETFSTLVLSFHMPLFFFVGGVLFKDRPINTLLIRRSYSLLLPLFCFYCLDFLIRTLITLLLLPMQEKLIDILSLRSGGWFIIAIFVVSILFALLYKLAKGRQWLLGVFVLVIYCLGLAASVLGVSADFHLKHAFVGIGFYYLGYLLGKQKVADRLRDASLTAKILVVAASVLILAASALIKNDYMVLMYDHNYGDPFLFTVKAILGSAAVIAICIVVDHFHIVERIGRLSLTIMILHFPIYISLRAVYYRFVEARLESDGAKLLISVACICFVTAITCLLASLLDKKLPVFTGRLPVEEK